MWWSVEADALGAFPSRAARDRAVERPASGSQSFQAPSTCRCCHMAPNMALCLACLKSLCNLPAQPPQACGCWEARWWSCASPEAHWHTWQARLDLNLWGIFCKLFLSNGVPSGWMPFHALALFSTMLPGCQTAQLWLPPPTAGMFQRNSSRKRRLQAKLAAVEVRRGAGAGLRLCSALQLLWQHEHTDPVQQSMKHTLWLGGRATSSRRIAARDSFPTQPPSVSP